MDSIDTIHSDLNNEKIKKSFDLLLFPNSGFRIELNGQVLEQEDLNLIGKNITFLMEYFFSPLKKRYSKQKILVPINSLKEVAPHTFFYNLIKYVIAEVLLLGIVFQYFFCKFH
ncbi:hypothetical protein [Paenibacillus sp. NPDC055715]